MAALPIAMLGATVLGVGAAWASTFTAESEKDSIQLQSGQHVRIQSRVRLSEDGKKNHPDSCLVASEDGIVTKVDIEGRKATVRCSKNRRAAPEELPANDLEVIDSGINAPGISIPGGYLTEGAAVRMLASSKVANKGKALASPFYNPVGTVMTIDKVAKQVVVLSNHLNNKSTAQEFYNIDDLEFVSGPSEAARKGAEAGLALKIGSTVELKDDATRQKYARGFIDRNLVGTNPNSNKLADPKWEKFGIVKSITLDPKDRTKKIVIVRCVSKDSKKEVVEQKYDFADLKAIPAISVERAGIAVFGGMAEMDTKVKLRSERKSAVASKSLGRSAFGDVGTVSDLEPNDPNNLKVFVTCNGINPDEQTGDWYQPEDLELAEPEDTEGEAVFGGRVVVGSTVRVMQSARGKKCLGTPEFGDVGTVKGIDPSAADNLKINVTCGRTDAKQSEWYDPRDLSLFFPVDESGSELEKAKVALAAAQKELSAWQLQPQTYRRSDNGREAKKALEDKVAAAQTEVDRLSGVGLDKTKAAEMRNDSEEKLDEAMKLKRELEAVRLKLSRDSTCKKPERSQKYKENTDRFVNNWLNDMTVDKSDYSKIRLEPLQYSNSYRVALTELQTAYNYLETQTENAATLKAYSELNQAKLALREDLKNDRSDTESFSNLDGKLLDVANKQKAFDSADTTPYKTALKTIDDKLKKLQEVTTQIQSAAYSGDSPAEKLLKRVEDLETKTNKDITDNATELTTSIGKYNAAFREEQGFKLELDLNKRMYEDKVNQLKKKDHKITQQEDVEVANLFEKVDESRLDYLIAQKDTLKARKEQALLSAKTTCSEITLESVKDMKEKIQKIINGKCNVLKTIDDLLDQVNDLIAKRRRAFTMSQAVLDPKFGDPKNATFDIPITSPEDRIKQIEEAMAEVEKEPTLGKLKDLTDLCGKYDKDTFLPEATNLEKYPPIQLKECTSNPGQEPSPPAGERPKKPDSSTTESPQILPPPAAPETPPMTPPGTPDESENEAPPECPFKIGDIVHITNPSFNRDDRWLVLNVENCQYVYVVPEGKSESTDKPIQLSISQIEAVAPPTAGKRKWPFYGRRTTRRHGGGPNEDRAVAQAKMVLAGRMRALRQTPNNPALIQAVNDATEALNRARNNKTDSENNPFYGAPPNIRPSAEQIAQQQLNEAKEQEKEDRELLEELEAEGAADDEKAEEEAAAKARAKFQAQSEADAKAEDKAEAAADARARAEAAAAARAAYLKALNDNLRKWIHLKFGELTAEEQADKFEEYKANLEKNADFWKSVNATISANVDAAYNKLKAAAAAAASAGRTVGVTAANIGKYLNPAEGIASIKSKFTEWADKRAAAQAAKDKKTADIIRERALNKGKTQEEADALVEEFLGKTAFKRKETKDAQRTAKSANKAKEAATKAYLSSKAKWDDYYEKYEDWAAKKAKFDECNAIYKADKDKWTKGRQEWSDKLIKTSQNLANDQIMRLQSRSVGSSLMLDEARKLMIDADAQQRTVMDAKTDLQFTLASSSDADIAKAVGFYEAEVQKLKTCISKGKEDAIAEYEKDLAEIEKRKREITTKTFEVKAPQENQQQGKKNYSNVKDSELPTRLQEARKSFNDANEKLRKNPNDKNAQDQKKGAEGRITGITAEFVKRNIPVPTSGGRRMTMRRRKF